jgi:response regulator NasT
VTVDNAGASSGVEPLRVVIAEDEVIIRLDLKEILVGAGYEVVGVTGRGDEALSLINEHVPDIAILDIKMAGMDGIQVARSINPEHSVAVLILTAFSQRDLIDEAREAGVAAYLVKPFRRNELLPALERVVVRRREGIADESEGARVDEPSDSADDKIETRRIIDSAKAVLMDKHGLGEADAFSFIQRTAMQTRRRMRDVARDVIEGSLAP